MAGFPERQARRRRKCLCVRGDWRPCVVAGLWCRRDVRSGRILWVLPTSAYVAVHGYLLLCLLDPLDNGTFFVRILPSLVPSASLSDLLPFEHHGRCGYGFSSSLSVGLVAIDLSLLSSPAGCCIFRVLRTSSVNRVRSSCLFHCPDAHCILPVPCLDVTYVSLLKKLRMSGPCQRCHSLCSWTRVSVFLAAGCVLSPALRIQSGS